MLVKQVQHKMLVFFYLMTSVSDVIVKNRK